MCDFKTGDLIVVKGFGQPQVFLYKTILNDVVFQDGSSYNRGNYAASQSSAIERVERYEPKKIVKSAIEIMRDLKAFGYKVDSYGEWCHLRYPSFTTEMWQYCDKEAPTTYEWLDSWIIRK